MTKTTPEYPSAIQCSKCGRTLIHTAKKSSWVQNEGSKDCTAEMKPISFEAAKKLVEEREYV